MYLANFGILLHKYIRVNCEIYLKLWGTFTLPPKTQTMKTCSHHPIIIHLETFAHHPSAC